LGHARVTRHCGVFQPAVLRRLEEREPRRRLAMGNSPSLAACWGKRTEVLKKASHRELLSSALEPQQYDLTLEPDVERSVFDGVVKITCDVRTKTNVVELHARDLLLGSATFTPSEARNGPRVASEIIVKARETRVVFRFEEALPIGRGVLEMNFHGTLNDQMHGFYRSEYLDSKGNKRHMATTQFESIDARRCFPCWDEPARKAHFAVTLVYPAGLTALSNMPPSRSEVRADGRREEVFDTTPKMSTYLLAFCVGDFECVSGVTKGGTTVRVFAVPGKSGQCAYALDCGIRALEFYNDFFGVPYPLPKLDMIAIPDFAAGAMENWGLVTYREVDLLCDLETASVAQKQRICIVVTHELSHQWFGNLVTMAWWDDLWLNEGFANWMETFATDKLEPSWQLWETFVVDQQCRALELDGLRNSHAIQVPIERAEEVEEVFDAISYSKGGSVVRMIYALLGPEDFRKGLTTYFTRHAYGNTETSDLWQAWADVSGKPIADMMGSWVEKKGYPVLKVINDPLEDDASIEVEVEQHLFVADGSQNPTDASMYWVVPVFAGSDSGGTPPVLMDKISQKISCPCARGASWLKLNFGQNVPMRVLYPASMLSRLAGAIQEGAFSAEDRAGLLCDAPALCAAGFQAPEVMVQLLERFGGEGNDKVWKQLSAVLRTIDRLMVQSMDMKVCEAFRRFAGELVDSAFHKVGWQSPTGESDNCKHLRGILVSLLAQFSANCSTVVAEGKSRCAAFFTDRASLSADIRRGVFAISMQAEGFQEVYEPLISVHNSTDDAAIRMDIYAALAVAPSAALRARTLDWALKGDVRSQDLTNIPSFVAASGRDGAEAVWAWIRDNYDVIVARFGSSVKLFGGLVQASGANFVTEERANEVEAFWTSKPECQALRRTIGQVAEGIRVRAKFLARMQASSLADAATWREAAGRLSA